jgi:uncharacterized repeat protein (TIGR04076 family)
MTERYDVSVKVISQKGVCAANHKVGDEWVIGSKTPEGICFTAFQSVFPGIRVFMFGGSYPWAADSEGTKTACPDPENPVVFEVRRIRK